MTEPTNRAPLRLRVDPVRVKTYRETGVYVRAWDEAAGKYVNADIIHLDRDSLIAWLKSRDSIDWPIGVIQVLFEHGQDDGEE